MKNQKGSRSTTRTENPSTEEQVVFKASGAKRSALMPRYDLIPYEGMKRLADRYELGLTKYTRDNWRHGLRDPAFIDQAKCHIMEHVLKYNNELEPDNDHLAAAAWGLFFLMESEAKHVADKA